MKGRKTKQKVSRKPIIIIILGIAVLACACLIIVTSRKPNVEKHSDPATKKIAEDTHKTMMAMAGIIQDAMFMTKHTNVVEYIQNRAGNLQIP